MDLPTIAFLQEKLMSKNSEYLVPVVNEFIAQREQKLLQLKRSIEQGRYTAIKPLIEEIDKYSSLAETGLKLKGLLQKEGGN